MRLVYIATCAIPSVAANGVHVMRMCAAFSDLGHTVTLVVPQRTDGLSRSIDVFDFYGVERSFEIVREPWPRIHGRSLVFAWYAAKRVAAIGPGLVYGRMVHACYFSALRGFPVILESHAPIAEYGAVGAFLFRRLLRAPSFERLVVISRALKTHYEDCYSTYEREILVAPDGANPICLSDAPHVSVGSKLTVGYVGGLYEGRGVDLIMRLAQTCSWAEFHLVGGTQAEVYRWRNAYDHLENVVFHGFQEPKDVERFLVRFDVLIAPYQERVSVYGNRWDTSRWMSPLKIFEYMAACKPIVASDLPVLREVLHEKNSILVSPSDVGQWASALKRLQSREVRRKLAMQSYAEFMEKYTWRARANRVLKCRGA